MLYNKRVLQSNIYLFYKSRGIKFDKIYNCCVLGRFLPQLAKQTLISVLSRSGIKEPRSKELLNKSEIIVDMDSVTIGKTKVPRFMTKDTSKVPDILFYNVPQVNF